MKHVYDAPDESPDRKIEAQYLVVLPSQDRKMLCLNFAYRTSVVGVVYDAPDESPDRKIAPQYLVALSGQDRKMLCLNFAYRTSVVGVVYTTRI